MSRITQFEKMLAAGQDSALLRFSLGNEYLSQSDADQAVEHLRAAVAQDADYSAAWKALGQALERSGDGDGAIEAYRSGIEAAERRGDKQVAKQMRVFQRRLEKQAP